MATQRNIKKDLGTLTSLDEESTNKLLKAIRLLIGQYVYETTLEKEDTTEIDLGFGTLLIKVDNNDPKAKIVFSEELTTDIDNIIKGKKSEFKKETNKTLTYKLTNIIRGII